MKSIADHVREFARNVAAQTAAFDRGDPVTGNLHAKRYIEAFEALRALGDPGRDALVPLLSDARKDVRGTAAAFLLRHRHAEARRVLEELSRGRDFDAFAAAQALARWDEGDWALDAVA